MKSKHIIDIISQQNKLLDKSFALAQAEQEKADQEAINSDRGTGGSDSSSWQEPRDLNSSPSLELDNTEAVSRNPSSEPVFDPNAPSEDLGVDKSFASKYSATEAAITGFGKGASMGYLPQIEAGLDPLIQGGLDIVMGDPQAAQKSRGFNIKKPESSYIQRRDAQAAAQKQMESEHPTASALGEAGGAITSAIGAQRFIPGKTPVKFFEKLGQAAKTGAITGALKNPGETEGTYSPAQPIQRAKNSVSDALFSTVFQTGASGLGKMGTVLAKGGRNMKASAEKRSLQAAGLMLRDARRLLGYRKANDVGRAGLEEGIVEAGDTIHGIAEKALVKRKEVGKQLGDIYDQADEIIGKEMSSERAAINSANDAYNSEIRKKPFWLKSELNMAGNDPSVGFSPSEMAKQLKKEVELKFKGLAGSSEIKSKLLKILKDIEDNPQSNFSRMKEIRLSIDEMINYGVDQKELGPVQKELKKFRNQFQDSVKLGLDQIDQRHGTKLKDNFVKTNKRLSNIMELEGIARDKASRDTANQTRGLSEKLGGYGLAGVGAKVGGIPGAIIGFGVGTLGEKAVRNYGKSTGAALTDKVAQIIMTNPKKLGVFAAPLIKAGNISPTSLSIAISNLMDNPEFVQTIGENP